jgi:hypothetical protein
VYSTRYEFYTKYSLSAHHITGLIHGHHRTVHGWALITTNPDGGETSSNSKNQRALDVQEYSFMNIKTGEIESMTSLEFRKKYGINRGVVKRMTGGEKYNIELCGWRLV